MFCRTAFRKSKNRVSESDVITINRFLGHCTAKYKDIGLKLCIFCHLFLKNRNFDFWGLKHKISKIRNSHFVKRVILHLLVFAGGVLL